jgi:two-component system CheB/CheR fusion protein
MFMVVFAEPASLAPGTPAPAPTPVPEHDATVAQFERELRDAREQLQSTAEEYETALEEVKSTNEELHSVNEELQSANEELETSKEEIQSMNEELQTVNAQLVAKVDELDRSSNDLRNLFDSTQVATVFLDRFMIIRSFTPAVGSIYNLIPSDHGRPLTDIVAQIDYPDLRHDVQQVLDALRPYERRVARHDGSQHYLVRILPYRAANNLADGALITFIDVTSIVQAEQHHRLLVDEMNHRVRNMLTVVISIALQTLRQTRTLEDFSAAFMGRVNALAAAYTLLSRDNWTAVPLRDVLLEELRPFMVTGRSNVTIEGVAVSLVPREALAIGLVAHELATNAVKYGALSVPDGELAIRWAVEPPENRERLVLLWTERGGPSVVAPKHNGFGRLMIERTLKHELKGEVVMEFVPEGLRVTLRMPLVSAVAARVPPMEPVS